MDYKNTTWSAEHERLIISILCVLGAIRVFIFSAAFPPFNNVDEQNHFDLVYKYSHGYAPCAGAEKYNRETVEFIMLYGSTEYLLVIPFPPMWTIPNVEKSPAFIEEVSGQQQQMNNYETGSFPVYYATAGLWYRIGSLLGIRGGNLIYWVRFLNIPLFALLIIISYMSAKSLYAAGNAARIALPLLVAFFPQDVFYSISNDALTPLLFGITFFMLVQIYNHEKPFWYYLVAGLFTAATFLTKVSNITVVFVLAVVILLKTKKLYGEKQLKPYSSRLTALLAALLIPTGAWLIRNYFMMGDALGTSQKADAFGLTLKPIDQLLNHPVFTPGGIGFFLAELTKTFWRGEFTRHFEIIANHGMDIFYIASTASFVLVSLAALLIRGKMSKENRFERGSSFFLLLVSVLFLLVLSVIFDFGNCPVPSRDKPYFTNGRLISGLLLPFLLIYLDGLKRLLSFLKIDKYLLLVVCVIVVMITWSEISISLDVFKSQYNWFHLICYYSR